LEYGLVVASRFDGKNTLSRHYRSCLQLALLILSDLEHVVAICSDQYSGCHRSGVLIQTLRGHFTEIKTIVANVTYLQLQGTSVGLHSN